MYVYGVNSLYVRALLSVVMFPGKDFMQKIVSITILPTMKQPTPTSTYDIDDILFDIVEDNINEYTQSFVLLASITLEAELKMTKVCFQESMMGNNCSGIGSVEIRILDNDRKYTVLLLCVLPYV